MAISERLPFIFWSIAVLVLGAVIGFFFVFRTLFTDGPASIWDPEYIVAHALNLVAYLVTAAFVMRRGIRPARLLLIPLLLPAAVTLAFYSDATLGLRGITVVVIAIGTTAGALLGAWWRRSTPRAQPTATK